MSVARLNPVVFAASLPVGGIHAPEGCPTPGQDDRRAHLSPRSAAGRRFRSGSKRPRPDSVILSACRTSISCGPAVARRLRAQRQAHPNSAALQRLCPIASGRPVGTPRRRTDLGGPRGPSRTGPSPTGGPASQPAVSRLRATRLPRRPVAEASRAGRLATAPSGPAPAERPGRFHAGRFLGPMSFGTARGSYQWTRRGALHGFQEL